MKKVLGKESPTSMKSSIHGIYVTIKFPIDKPSLAIEDIHQFLRLLHKFRKGK